jgi:hypothetical protein
MPLNEPKLLLPDMVPMLLPPPDAAPLLPLNPLPPAGPLLDSPELGVPPPSAASSIPALAPHPATVSTSASAIQSRIGFMAISPYFHA